VWHIDILCQFYCLNAPLAKCLTELNRHRRLDNVPGKGWVLLGFVTDSVKRCEVVSYYEMCLLNRDTLRLWVK
jgi:hypothetical protein